MNIEYQNIETTNRGYKGVSVTETECREHLQGAVKDNLIDREEREDTLEKLRALQSETGFKVSEQLLIDIQTLESEEIDERIFRVSEAYAGIILEEHFSCRFHWNELRDSRNPKGNKPGADLVGFIEIDGEILFLFGEVKTSSENRRPPQVMTYSDGIEKQLLDLYNNPSKRLILITYLKSKAKLFPDNHQFKIDLNEGIKSYYSENNKYQLIGVLVRNIEPNKRDVLPSYDRLKRDILEPTGLQLLALYTPINSSDWLKTINGSEE
ncbi:hypothetical protein ACMCNP_03385 [Candidatus Acidulodesulfobacterium sp. H_13]|uniref:hypothetical protein n=1 Tax=Candidatus Acidulodesulfobacterium sp. H_13 TaxID=3395470 RepID=UPI003AF913A6